MMKADPTSTDPSGDYKFSYNVFEEGSIETLIRFLNYFDKRRHGKLVPPGIRQFHVFDSMLDGEAKERWALNVTTHTECELIDKVKKMLIVPGEMAETFSNAKRAWIVSYFDTESLLLMQEYLCTQLKFPLNRNVPTKDWVNHLQQINMKLTCFQHHKKSKGDNFLSNQELKYIIYKDTPLTWQTKLHLIGKILFQYNIQALTEFFEVVQQDTKQARDKNHSSKTKNNLKTRGKHSGENGDNGQSVKKKKTFCKNCKCNSTSDWVINSHYMDECSDSDGKTAKAQCKRRTSKSDKQYNKLMAMVVNLTKRRK